MTKIGTRVIAVSHFEDDIVYIFGYGLYVGDEIPPIGTLGALGLDLGMLGHTNPKIILDNGKIVWGCQCWFGNIKRIEKEIIRNRKIKIVDIDEICKNARKNRN